MKPVPLVSIYANVSKLKYRQIILLLTSYNDASKSN